MDVTILLSLALLLILFCVLGSGIWVSFSLFIVGTATIMLFRPDQIPNLYKSVASDIWGVSKSWELAALPMFIWMGEVLFRSKLSESMFRGLAPWMRNIPGRLLHVNIFGCAIFAAVSGSSAATAATIGKMSVPELNKRGYPEKMMLGTLAGSATLGLLIPPSIILIVYGVATEQSIARLFIAGVLPGLMLVSLFVGYTAIWSLLNRSSVPKIEESYTFLNKLWESRHLIPVLLLIGGVMGTIYTGLASPTDAAAVSVIIALLFTWLTGSLSWKMFKESLMGAVVTSCMIAFILAGAAFLTKAMKLSGLPSDLATWIGTLGLSTYGLLIALTVFFVILGMFLDGISVVVLTVAVILPMVESVGIDPLWFGIFLVIVVEMSQITPPVGFNLFVLQSLTGRNIFSIAYAALPFFMLMLLGVALIVIFPEIVTYLPNQMGG